MSAELGQRGQTSPTTDEVIQSRLKSIENTLPDQTRAREQSIVMLSTLVGALLLSRSANAPELSDQILDTTREWLKQQVTA